MKSPTRTAEADRVPLPEKVGYGVIQIANSLGSSVPHTIGNQVFNMTLGVAPTFVTGALAVFRFVDAFTDLLIGWLSDRFQSRWGRRRPFILVGLLGMAVLLPMLFHFGRDWGTSHIMAWFIVVGLGYYVFDTMLNVPYQSLGLEMTADYHERTSIQAFKAVIAKIGIIAMGWMWFFTQLPIFADPVTGQPDTLRGAQGLSLLVAGLILLFGIPPLFLCRERYYQTAKKGKKEPFIHNFKLTIGNRPFRLLLLMVACMQIPNLVNGLGMYLSTYYVFGGDQKSAAWIGGIGNTVSSVLAFAAVPAVSWLSRRYGKEPVLRWIILANVLVAISAVFIYNPQYPYLMLIKFALAAPLVTGLWMLLPSMQSDVVDYDELLTGERREGSFAAVFSWLMKFCSTFAYGFSGVILDLVGFDAKRGGDQAPWVFPVLIGLLVTIPLVVTALQYAILRRYPLNQETATANRAELENRRGRIG